MKTLKTLIIDVYIMFTGIKAGHKPLQNVIFEGVFVQLVEEVNI